jgi:hypothetical protein
MNVEKMKISVSANAMFGDFLIEISNTHGRTILYKVSEKSKRDGWIRVTDKAEDYIINDFKKTVEHNKLIAIIKEATKEYGY